MATEGPSYETQTNKVGPYVRKESSTIKENDSAPVNHEAAYAGPNLWERTFDNTELNLESLEYLDLDNFLFESGIAVDPNNVSELTEIDTSIITSSWEAGNASSLADAANLQPNRLESVQSQVCSQKESDENSDEESVSSPSSPEEVSRSKKGCSSRRRAGRTKRRDCTRRHYSSSSDSDEYDAEGALELSVANIPGEKNFDPKTHKFDIHELKPQPLIKKSRKVIVPDNHKDERYWSRRKKNNVAAKRSRDARRVKENRIAMRASFLENENDQLKTELAKVKEKNVKLKRKLAKYKDRA